MRVFMIGNGFDLFYNLPTKYVNFLQVTKHLIDNIDKPELVNSVAAVLSSVSKAYPKSNFNTCITKYGADYDAPLDVDSVREYTQLASLNVWYNYLINSFNKDVGWIDFETEIGKVIQAIKLILKEGPYYYKSKLWCKITPSEKVNTHILLQFPIFLEIAGKEERYDTSTGKLSEILFPVRHDYILEEPKGSGYFKINEEKVASELYKSSRQLASLLSMYLSWFVEGPVKILSAKNKLPLYDALSPSNGMSYIISFNYTHTAELLKYYDNQTGNEIKGDDRYCYIHGHLLPKISQIVLGINADEDDKSVTADTRFIQFKKYYQRVFYKTDLSYLDFLRETDKTIQRRKERFSIDTGVGEYNLIVIGHSLDVTDREVIIDVFTRSQYISILYHDESAIKGYMSNLITIFGKEGFDDLRFSRHLEFLPLSSLEDRLSFNKH